ncbi:stage VI sporulation protein D [Sutcliffiella deserti]|uniref:stage VI sporulation protein D n=1 Tax=Sutcliffiella deserti TaxID=2875501 RepID=UPI001CBBC015|nr:stage VI sporulation protein D [Sutcliffiella deserti]
MSSEQQSCLRFSVEESVWFQKGQEVSELISIALDPEIQIYEQDQYVSIRGALLLSGEYHKNEVDEEEEEYRPFTQARMVQEVEEREEGLCALKHRFPVDITIPKNRIQSLDDIYVAIESFDYSVPARGCLQLDAELSISGIYGHQQSVPVVDAEEDREEVAEAQNQVDIADAQDEQEVAEFQYEEEVENSDEQREEEFVPAFNVTNEPEWEPMFRNSEEYNNREEEHVPYYATDEEDEEEEILNQHEIDQNVEYDYNNHGEYEPFEVEARKNAVLDDVEPTSHTPHDYTETVTTEDSFTPTYAFQSNNKSNSETEDKPHNIASFFEKRKTKQEEPRVEEQAEVMQESSDENSLSLTKIFAEEEGEEFTRLKICIVQEGESIDHIAERYDVTIQQLIRTNRLSTEDNVHEGQLLYIPVKAVSKL